jgi:CheY-like chemotaxis protein
VNLVIEEPQVAIDLETDEGKLSQILRNFVSNALKFTERGAVTVTAEPAADDCVVITVRDTGIGIAPEHVSYIFEEFTQVENPLQSKAKGTGLGLPLSRRLAELLGGRVTVESEVGAGSTFTVTIPRVMNAARAAAAASVIAARPMAAAARRVLVVDDDSTARYVVAQLVRQLGGEPVEATNGAEAAALAVRVQPELILADLRMPQMDGFQLVQQLRSDPRTASVPIVIVTSSLITEAEQSRLQGIDAIISKAELSAETLARWLSPVAQRELVQGG